MKINLHGIMILLIFFSSFFYLILAASNAPPRSVNVALETSFLFEPKDVNHNIAFVNNIKTFLDKLYNVLEPQAKQLQQLRARRLESKPTFTDFLKEVGQKIVNFTNDKIGKAVESIKAEAENAGDKAGGIKDVIDKDMGVKKYVQDTINGIFEGHPIYIKKCVRKLMDERNPLLHSFARRMNDYYHPDEIKKLNKIVHKITTYLDNDKDTSKLVRKALKIGVLNKINNLNESTRINLIHDVKLLSEFVKQQNAKEQVRRQNSKALDSREENENFIDDINDSEQKYSIYDDKNMAKKIGDYLDEAGKKLNEEKHTNEVIVDNVELFLKRPLQ